MSDAPLRAWVDPAIHERHPDYVAVVVVADGLHNGPSDGDADQRLAAAEDHLRARGLTRAADDPHLAAWRQAFSAFGAKPKKYPSSAEALAARVLKGQPLPRINRLVDLYNAVSVTHLVPLGGEDRDKLVGDLRLVVATGDERFDPRGDGAVVDHPAPGEVVWRDDAGVTCRRWNWRQGARTQLTAQTRSAFFVLDCLAPLAPGRRDAVVAELADGLRAMCPGASVAVQTLTA